MTCDPRCVENAKNAREGMKINLRNGECLKITKCGIVKLKNGLILKNVLVVFEFKHNLLFVNKLTIIGKWKVNFYAGYCMIVDHETSELKGVGECRNELYYLLNDDMENIVANLKHMTLSTGLNAEKTPVKITHGWVETEKQNETMP